MLHRCSYSLKVLGNLNKVDGYINFVYTVLDYTTLHWIALWERYIEELLFFSLQPSFLMLAVLWGQIILII